MAETPLLPVGGVDENKEKDLLNNNNDNTNNDEQSTFRNKPIKWITESKLKTKTIKSRFDNEPEERQYTGADHFISYEGKEYTKEKFLSEHFKDYKQ